MSDVEVIETEGPTVVVTEESVTVIEASTPGPEGPAGPTGPTGPPGPPGAGSSTEIEIATASAVWNVNHQLNAFPAVTTLDSTRRVVYGNVEYIDANNIRITFSASMAGYVLIN